MPAQRKLFFAHASELAYLCVRAVGISCRVATGNVPAIGGLVSEFVNAYAERYNRRGLGINPERNREFDSTIGREALLVMAAKVYLMLPEAFAHRTSKARGQGPALNPQEALLSQAFFAEFMASLARSLEWPRAEAAAEDTAFRRDLEMYQRWGARSGSPRAAADAAEQSPFPDRCALLLDPAMMEQARRAATEFEVELARAAARMFNQLGRRPAPRTKSRHRPKPRAKKKIHTPRNRPTKKKKKEKKKTTRSPRRPRKSAQR